MFKNNTLIEGLHYHIDEKGKWVFTSYFLLNRGYCCHSGCRNCPYGADMKADMKIEPGQYIWRSNNTDFPVTVVEILGKGQDGRFYVKVADSNTAVPADELVKVTNATSRRPEPKRLF